MKANVGMLDRAVRVIVGIVLVALAAAGTIGHWGYIGIVPLVTGWLAYCPAYKLLGFTTCPMKGTSS